jgi:hypothetical protein
MNKAIETLENHIAETNRLLDSCEKDIINFQMIFEKSLNHKDKLTRYLDEYTDALVKLR